MFINIKKMRKFEEDKITQKINLINNPNLTYEQKRLIVLSQMNTSSDYPSIIYFPDNKIVLFDINKVRAFREKKIEEKIMNIKDPKLSKLEKRLIVLNEMNTSFSSNDEEQEKVKPIIIKPVKPIIIEEVNPIIKAEVIQEVNIEERKEVQMESFSDDFQSTMNSSSMSIDNPSMNSKKDYWLKYKLYDVKVNNKNLDKLNIYQLSDDKCCYFYKNELITYYFVKSVKFGENYSIDNESLKDPEYKESFGLFFCGKNINYNNEKDVKCCPNQMICKECMKKNKKIYNLDKLYLININGRLAKKRKDGNFHCFGHFIKGNLIENCVKEFTCEACKLLKSYENYYFPND